MLEETKLPSTVAKRPATMASKLLRRILKCIEHPEPGRLSPPPAGEVGEVARRRQIPRLLRTPPGSSAALLCLSSQAL